MTEPSLADELLSFADLIFKLVRFPTSFRVLVALGDIQVDIVVDEYVSAHIFCC